MPKRLIIQTLRRINETMKYIQDNLLQPQHDDILIRYMDKRKYESIVERGLVFSQVAGQSDPHDGTMFHDDSGFARFNNNYHENSYRSNNYISCWTLDKEPMLEKFNEYCKNINEPKYALKTTYSRLINFCKQKCYIVNGNHIFLQTYTLLYGKVEYINFEETLMADVKPWDNGLMGRVFFYKDKKYKFENEFRLLLLLSSAKITPSNYNYIVESGKAAVGIQSMYGEKPDFIDSVYVCSTDGVIHKIDM